jgi:hypothetical protein
MDTPTLQLYTQGQNHDEAFVVGDRAGLLALRAAIDAALAAGRGGCDAFVSDGEGYRVHVLCLPPNRMAELQYPYTERTLPDGTVQTWLMGGAMHPLQLIGHPKE